MHEVAQMRGSPVFGPVMTTHLVESSMEMLMGTTGDGFAVSKVLLNVRCVSLTRLALLARPPSPELVAKADARREDGVDGLAVGFFCTRTHLNVDTAISLPQECNNTSTLF
jgi:hypothetical protein